jgi:hypothetical protein
MPLPKQLAFCSAPFGIAALASEDFHQIGTVNPQPDGVHFTLSWAPTAAGIVPDKPTTVLSVQPDGSYQTRQQGTAGAYEVFTLDGGSLVVRPNWNPATQSPFFPPPVPTVAYVIGAKSLA